MLARSIRRLRTRVLSESLARRARRWAEPLEGRRLLSLTIPQYASRPGAAVTVFLDFDGNAPFSWNNGTMWAVHGPGGTSDPVPAFNLDADPNNFSDAEKTEIGEVWQWVSEKFSPFDVNVTTVDPGNRDDNKTVQVLFGGTHDDWYDGTGGGVGAIGGFSNASLGNTCFVFTADPVNVGNPSDWRVHYMGETAAHEAGHEFGLRHERTPGANPGDDPEEYYPGDATRSPIMGGSNNNHTAGSRGIWWKTNNFAGQNSPDSVQDELAVLTSNTGHPLTLRGDDRVGPGVLFMTNDGRVSPAVTGLIERTTDVDAFSFSAATNRATFTVDNAPYGGMLAPKVRIYNSSGNTVSATVTQTNNKATISTDSLVGGQTYYLEVGSQGNYGDIGQFSITGSMQQFASYDPITRFINVGGLSGNNNITLSVINDGTTQGALRISDSVNGGTPFVQTFQMAGLNVIDITLAAGNDTLTVRPLHTLNGLHGPGVRFDGSGGTDTLWLDSYTDPATTFSVNSGIQVTMATTDVVFFGLEAVNLWSNNAYNNTFNVHYYGSVAPLGIYGGSGSDVLNVDPSVVTGQGSPLSFYGGGGNDAMYLDSSTSSLGHQFNIFDGLVNVITDQGPQRDFEFDSVEYVTIYGGSGGDYADVYFLGATTSARFNGNGGDDLMEVGDPYDNLDWSGMLGSAIFAGGAGDDTLRILDYTATTGRTYTIGNSYADSNVSGPAYADGEVEHMNLLGSPVASTYNVSGGAVLPVITLSAGSGNDSFNFIATYWNAVVQGGGGLDTLTVDDRTANFISPYRGDLSATAYARRFGTPSISTTYTIQYSGIDSQNYFAAASMTTLNITGTAPTALGYQYTFICNSGNDNVTIYPHDAAGTGTILGPLGLGGGGGADTVTFDDSTQTLGQNYTFYNQYGPGTQNIGGIGAGGFGTGADMENIVIKAGSGNDVFTLTTFQTGNALSVFGNNGDDRFDISPIARNTQTNLTNMSGFSFNGGSGGDALRVFNDNNANAWTYTLDGGGIQVQTGGYYLNLLHAATELVYASGGSAVDNFNVHTVGTGQRFQLAGGGAADVYTLGNGAKTGSIFGTVQIDGGAGDTFTVDDSADSTGRTVHVLQGRVGGVPVDTLFGAGGMLVFSGITSTGTIKTGSGADTVYAAPNVSTPISLIGGSPTTSPGDTLGFALAGVTSPSIGSSSLTSGNRATLSFSGFESTSSDASGPAVSSGTYAYNAATPAVDVAFSEAIGWNFDGGSITLLNNTTGQTIAAAALSATYDPATRTVHFTFPSLTNTTLPDGRYHATVAAGPADAYGNQIAATSFDFYVLAGDADHNAKVDFNDLLVMAKNYGKTGQTFAQGNFDYSNNGLVDFTDLLILAKHYNVTLPAAAAGDAALADVSTSRRQRVSNAVLT